MEKKSCERCTTARRLQKPFMSSWDDSRETLWLPQKPTRVEIARVGLGRSKQVKGEFFAEGK